MVTGTGSSNLFSCLMTDTLPDLEVVSKNQCFPRYIYDAPKSHDLFASGSASTFTQRDALTDRALTTFQQHYQDMAITKDDLFYYVYGILHSPDYRTRFAADLKKQLPRIPFAPDFWGFSRSGRALGDLHCGYENVEPYPLEEIVAQNAPADLNERYRVQKIRWAKKGEKVVDQTTLIVNEWITLTNIPPEALTYQVNGRAPIEWVIDRYRVKVDKDSGILNDPNEWSDDPRYIVNLVKRVVRISVETLRIVDRLPKLQFDDGNPSNQ